MIVLLLYCTNSPRVFGKELQGIDAKLEEIYFSLQQHLVLSGTPQVVVPVVFWTLMWLEFCVDSLKSQSCKRLIYSA